MLKAAIFDLDGLLVNSEPLWRVAEIEAFDSVGLSLQPDQCGETIGLRTDEVVAWWFERHPWDETATPLEEVESRIEGRVVEQLREDCPVRPGVEHAITFFESRGLSLAIASSSPLTIIRAALEGLGVQDRFVVLSSAETESLGKPDPAVYLSAARRLGVSPGSCVALEDSLAGLTAAKRAGMRCVLVPDESLRQAGLETGADVLLSSLANLDPYVWSVLSRIESHPEVSR